MLGWTTGFSLLYYVLGKAVLGETPTKVQRIISGKYGIVILLSAIIVCIFVQWGYNWIFLEGKLQTLNVEKGWITDVVWDGYNALPIVCLTSLLGLLFKCVKWKEHRFWLFVGKNSLAIYVLQTPVQRVIEYMLPVHTWSNQYHILGLVLPILTLFVSVGITYILLKNKYTRYLIRL